MRRTTILTLSVFVAASLPLITFSRDVVVQSGQVRASIVVEQISASSLGNWTIISGDNPPLSSTDKGVNKISYSFSLTSFGPTVVTVTPPPGMSAAITVYRGGTVLKKVPLPQYSFNLLPNDEYRFIVQYSLARLSGLGVTSEPSGEKFRVKSPSGKSFTGVTPASFSNLPAGKYVITFGKTGTCQVPPLHSIVLKPDERNIVNVSMTCVSAAAEVPIIRSTVTKRSIRQIVEEREAKARGERK